MDESFPGLSKAEPLPVELRSEPSPLSLDHRYLDLSNDVEALEKALVAYSLSCDSQGELLRRAATLALVNRMALDRFVQGHPFYRNADRAATVLLDGLCKRRHLVRTQKRMRSDNTSGPATKGYCITLFGRSEVERIRAGTKREPEPETVSVEEERTFEETHRRLEELLSPGRDIEQKLAANHDRLKPLFEEHDKLTAEAQEYQHLIAEIVRRRDELNAELKSWQEMESQIAFKITEIEQKVAAVLSNS